MSTATIAATRNHLSSIVAELVNHDLSEHIILNRNRPVAKIVPITDTFDTGKRIGVCKNEPLQIDDTAFDEADDAIASLFGL